MLIDWFTVTAQIVNFLLLVWLLKRFLYRPILQAIDAREQRIAQELADAAKQQIQACAQREAYEHKNKVFDEQREKHMQQAVDAANTEQLRLLEEAQQAATALRVKHEQTLIADANHKMNALSAQVAQEVFAIARKTLSDLASSPIEQCMTEVFICRLSELDPAAKEALATAFNTQNSLKTDPSLKPHHLLQTHQPAKTTGLIRSAFALPDTQRQAIEHAINQTFTTNISLQFEIAEQLISGIELSVNGQILAWSINDYLASLEEGVNALLKQKASNQTSPKSKTSEPQFSKTQTPKPQNLKSQTAAPLAEAENHE